MELVLNQEGLTTDGAVATLRAVLHRPDVAAKWAQARANQTNMPVAVCAYQGELGDYMYCWDWDIALVNMAGLEIFRIYRPRRLPVWGKWVRAGRVAEFETRRPKYD